MKLLAAHGIERIVDVRRFPASRRHPHFEKERLEEILRESNIDYVWMPTLGGRRSPKKDSTNTGWRVAGFRGYADYMETSEFSAALEELLTAAHDRRTAVMCAEQLWWQCHRRLISDALVARGHEVLHVQSVKDAKPHKLIPPARIEDGKLSYVGEQSNLEL